MTDAALAFALYLAASVAAIGWLVSSLDRELEDAADWASADAALADPAPRFRYAVGAAERVETVYEGGLEVTHRFRRDGEHLIEIEGPIEEDD
jgi:hypothetical protein